MSSQTFSKDDEPIFFWRPHEEYGFLGQWYPSPFTTQSPLSPSETVTFPNCETYMMFHKAILFDDAEVAQEILEAGEDPKMVKALGRKVKGFDATIWDERKFGIVVDGNREKFGQNGDLRELLVKTEGRELIEASPLDRIWGIGFGKTNAMKMQNKRRWGKNLLGKALMQVRDELVAARKAKT